MIHAQDIHSLSDFQRNTTRHLRHLRESGLPEVLTVKGRAELVIQSAEAYDALLAKLEFYESAEAIKRGLQQISEGKSGSLQDFDQKMRAKIAAQDQTEA